MKKYIKATVNEKGSYNITLNCNFDCMRSYSTTLSLDEFEELIDECEVGGGEVLDMLLKKAYNTEDIDCDEVSFMVTDSIDGTLYGKYDIDF